MADVKGDLSGISQSGNIGEKLAATLKELQAVKQAADEWDRVAAAVGEYVEVEAGTVPPRAKGVGPQTFEVPDLAVLRRRIVDAEASQVEKAKQDIEWHRREFAAAEMVFSEEDISDLILIAKGFDE
jgi:hypothetical protein